MIVNLNNKMEDYAALSQHLDVPFKITYYWVRFGEEIGSGKVGKRPRILTDNEITQ